MEKTPNNINTACQAPQAARAAAELLADEASAWIARLSNDQVSITDRQEFALWLERSAEHRAAYDSVETLWLDLGCLKYASLEAEVAETAIEDQPQPGEGIPSYLKEKFRSSRKIKPFAAATLLTVLAGFVAVWQLPETVQNQQSFATAIGEQNVQRLADGSEIHLNTNTRVEISYSDSQRSVSISQGEAHFTVAKDKQRPFVVSVPGAAVTAVGTAFNIEVETQQTLVTVTEGVIQVEEQNDSAHRAESLIAREHHQVSIDRVAGLDRIILDETTDTTAWQQQNLVFRKATLAYVIAELNRYNSLKIKIAEPSLAYLQVSGVFKLDKPAETLKAIEASLGLESKQQDQIILLYDQG